MPQPTTYIEGEGGNDIIVSGNGADELLGGDGNDTMQSFEGPDTVRGEGGDDSVSAGKEEPETNVADVVDGGPGFDRIPDVDADYNRGFDDNVAVSVDGQPNDGEAGEGDNVIAVEKIRVTADQATVVGSDANDDFFVEANGGTIKGLGGNDRLVAYDGHDTLEGGDGDDYLEGGFGNDVLDRWARRGPVPWATAPRQQRNRRSATTRSARVTAVAEQVSCGLGSDTAQVDSERRGGRQLRVHRPLGAATDAFGAKTLVTLRLAIGEDPRSGDRIAIRSRERERLRDHRGGLGPDDQAGGDRSAQAAREAEGEVLQASPRTARKTVKLKLPASLPSEC